jgi:integrase
LIKQKRGRGEPMWILDWSGSDGTRRRQSLSRDKRTAERMRAEIISKRDLELAGLTTIAGQSRPLAELKDLYIADLNTRCTSRHVHNARTRIARVLDAVRVQRVRDLQPHHLLQVRARRVADGVSHATANAEIRHTRAMLSWGERCGLIAQNPIHSIKPLPLKGHIRHQRRALSDEEIERFLAAAREDDRVKQDRWSAKLSILAGSKGKTWNERPRSERVPQYATWLGLLETGARHTEFISTTWGDLDVNTRALTLRAENTKARKSRVIPMRDALVQEIVALRAIHGRVLARPLRSEDRIFLTPRGVPWTRNSRRALYNFNGILRRAGIARVDGHGQVLDIHALRHTCATRLARAGVPITHTQKLLGPSSIELTAKYYTHLGLDDLRGAIERVAGEESAPRRLRVLRSVGDSQRERS